MDHLSQAETTTSQPKLFLHDHPASSYAQKIRIALREKGIPFEARTPVKLGSGHVLHDLKSTNPRREVPALVDGDFALFNSTIIMAYLEESYPETKLLPDSPRERAEARMIEEICDTHYDAAIWAAGEITLGRVEGKRADALMEQIKAQAGTIQDWLAERLGDRAYFNGNTFGYADVCVAPIYNRAAVNGCGAAEGSALQQWHVRIQQRASVRDTFAEFEDSRTKFVAMKGAYMNEYFKREYCDHRLEFLVKSGAIDLVLKGLEWSGNGIRFSWPEPLRLGHIK